MENPNSSDHQNNIDQLISSEDHHQIIISQSSSSPPPTTTIRSYECTFCKRGFTNAQALGGHMNIHRKDKAKLRQSAFSVDHHIEITEPPRRIQFSDTPKIIIKTDLSSLKGSDHHSNTKIIAPSDDHETTTKCPNLFLDDHRDGGDKKPDDRSSDSDLDLELRLGPEPPPQDSSSTTATRKFF